MAALALVAATLLATLAPGRYELRATALVDASGVPARKYAERVLALVGPGPGGGGRAVGVRLSSRGFECDLVAATAGDGELRFDPGQACRLDVDQADARAKLGARLVRGSGTLRDGELLLALDWDVDGTVQQRLVADGQVPGVGATWSPVVPVRGTARTEGRGRADAAPR
jgi:hypothetical protein